MQNFHFTRIENCYCLRECCWWLSTAAFCISRETLLLLHSVNDGEIIFNQGGQFFLSPPRFTETFFINIVPSRPQILICDWHGSYYNVEFVELANRMILSLLNCLVTLVIGRNLSIELFSSLWKATGTPPLMTS